MPGPGKVGPNAARGIRVLQALQLQKDVLSWQQEGGCIASRSNAVPLHMQRRIEHIAILDFHGETNHRGKAWACTYHLHDGEAAVFVDFFRCIKDHQAVAQGRRR